MTKEEQIKEFVNRLKAIEAEIEMLREDRKDLFHEYKDNFTPNVLRAAVNIAKTRTRYAGSVVELDNLIEQLDGDI